MNKLSRHQTVVLAIVMGSLYGVMQFLALFVGTP